MPVTTPTIIVSFSGSTATITVGNVQGTVSIYYKEMLQGSWLLGGTVLADGTLDIQGLSQDRYYAFYAVAFDSVEYSEPAVLVNQYCPRSAADPLTRVYEGLWALIDSDAALTALVKPGNRIKYSERNQDPEKRKRSNSDFPELVIVPAGGNFQIKRTNTTTSMVQAFDVEISVDDLIIDRKFFPVKWALLNLLSEADKHLGLSFVRHISLEDVTDERNDLEKRIPGWKTYFKINVEMWFTLT